MNYTISSIDSSAAGIIALLAAAGMFSLWGAVKNSDWFLQFTSIETLLGRSAARIFYGALGVILIAFAVFVAVTHYNGLLSQK
jgi:hypothetical protein